MPSWNIHTAHVERLLAEGPSCALGISSVNDFLFGNLAPDVYVGYMVPNTSRTIPYRETHLANPGFIPVPDASLFYERYLLGGSASDVVVGAWCHLLCDHYYNRRTVEYIDRIGVAAGEQTRIRKQGDFDLFGRTLRISSVPHVTDELLVHAGDFPQYAIEPTDVEASVVAAAGIVSKNQERCVEGVPEYSLLTADFFQSTFDEVHQALLEALRMRAAGEHPLHLGRP